MYSSALMMPSKQDSRRLAPANTCVHSDRMFCLAMFCRMRDPTGMQSGTHSIYMSEQQGMSHCKRPPLRLWPTRCTQHNKVHLVCRWDKKPEANMAGQDHLVLLGNLKCCFSWECTNQLLCEQSYILLAEGCANWSGILVMSLNVHNLQ